MKNLVFQRYFKILKFSQPTYGYAWVGTGIWWYSVDILALDLPLKLKASVDLVTNFIIIDNTAVMDPLLCARCLRDFSRYRNGIFSSHSRHKYGYIIYVTLAPIRSLQIERKNALLQQKSYYYRYHVLYVCCWVNIFFNVHRYEFFQKEVVWEGHSLFSRCRGPNKYAPLLNCKSYL